VNGFWNNKRAVVAGGAGFLGAVVVRKLRERGCSNISIPRSSECDLRQAAAVERMFAEAKPDVVIHLAAVVGGIGANRKNPGKFLYDNLLMGAHIIEQARKAQLEKLVLLGTVCSYPKFAPVPFKEEDLWNGFPEETNAPYGIAKKTLLVQAQAYRQQYGLNSIFLLPVNLYGPGDNFDLEASHVIPALIRKCIEARARGDKQLVVWGTGAPTREFLYVDDCAEGILRAAEHYNKPEPVNLGSGREISIRDLVTLICNATGFRGDIVWDTARPDGQPRRSLDVSRAAQEFGFTASVSLEAGLEQTVRWYRKQNPLAAGAR
jgi:GDP-L-fucose synthase